MIDDKGLLVLVVGGLGYLALNKFYRSLSPIEAFLFLAIVFSGLSLGLIFFWNHFSKWGRERKNRLKIIKDIPTSLLQKSEESIALGRDENLQIPIFLPDSIRSKHVHIMGATGSGKTESVILNFLKQDVARGYGSIVLDAKGDASFIRSLKGFVPEERLKIFDLGTEKSLTYDPLSSGTPIEASERLFSSLTWSEEYYKSKALSALNRLFESHFKAHGRNPKLTDLEHYLNDPEAYASRTMEDGYPFKLAEKDFMELSGLRDQIKSLCISHLSLTLSPKDDPQIRLEEAKNGQVLYFRLQSLLSSQLVSRVGKLLVNHMRYLVGVEHRETEVKKHKLVPVYLDEFGSFMSPEFSDLVSKARSAGFALHFSHQSLGDIPPEYKNLLTQMTDNSGTKILMRIYDPDCADFFARTYGTEVYQKMTQRVTNAKEIDKAEVLSEGTQRSAHQFRSSPDLFKSLPTGMGSVLIAHGESTERGAVNVFKIKFPKLEKEEECIRST